MAVYTHVSSEDLQRFLSSFDLGPLLTAKGIAEGVSNSNYLVETASGRFILTLFEARMDPAELPFFIGLIDHLAQQGLPVPGPVADRSGQVLHALCGRPACLIHFVDGVSVSLPTVRHCHAVGVALGQIRKATAGFDGTRPNALGLAGWHHLAAACQGQLDAITQGLEVQVTTALAAARQHWPQQLPRTVIHADLFADNVLFLGDAISGLIDFYFACTDIAAYDLAVGLNAWAFDATGSVHDATHAAALVAGYETVQSLSAAEKAALPVLCAGASLRFLLTRSYDWLNRQADALVTPKDPLPFSRRLAFYTAASPEQCMGRA